MKEFKLGKPKAKTEIFIKNDKEDDWFVYIIHVEKKSGKETSKSMIIRKDLEQHLISFFSKGWVELEKEVKVKTKKK